ncbi:hypothetical protein BS47DRAFT_632239 [Hydnum rufescens UP504]|uniref:F-box domain-containing protein n=1 Tax=Hydnum rufescens UP504 TaxID=1448309 RepID=A0A9P6AG88_9AGAM|nr:hypothetical protein BS47DRAFT_632239 [Hydnum rufescens UP504]
MQSPPQTPRRGKRQTRDESEWEDADSSSPSQGSPTKRKKLWTEPQSPPLTPVKVNSKVLVWRDIPQWEDDRCPFFDLPVEILDKITSTSSHLELCDYVALSGVSRMIRALFTAEVWKALLLNTCTFPCAIRHGYNSCVDRIWSTGWLAGHAKNPFEIPDDRDVGACPEREALTTAALKTLKYRRSPNSHHHCAPEMWLFPEAAVYRMALMTHGGPFGHEAYLKKVAETAAKAKATKEANRAIFDQGPTHSQAPGAGSAELYPDKQ